MEMIKIVSGGHYIDLGRYLLKDTEKLNLTTRPTLKSIEDNLDWLCKQVATTLDTVLTAESMAQSEGCLQILIFR